MNILCNKGGFVNEGDLGFLEGDWSKMREPPPNGGALATMQVQYFCYMVGVYYILCENVYFTCVGKAK